MEAHTPKHQAGEPRDHPSLWRVLRARVLTPLAYARR